MRDTRWPWVPAVVALSCGALGAQPSARCDGRTVTAIAITTRDPSFLAVPRALRAIARSAGQVHTTTKPEVVGRFLLLDVGSRCSERARAESERILRLQPFLAEATVRAVPDSTGGVRIEVETIDEIPTVFGVKFRGMNPSSLRLGNGNAAGLGLYLAASVERRVAYRTGGGLHIVAYQAFGRPYMLAIEAERAPLGSALKLALGHAFLSDGQVRAWHAGYDDVTRYLQYAVPDGDALSLSVRRRFWDVGSVRRLGNGRRRAFAGGLLTHEDVKPADRVVIVSDSGLVVGTDATIGGPTPAYRNIRLNAVVGVRALTFTPVRGFDALMGVQDVATGVQVGTLVGWGMPRLGSNDDDALVSVDLYAGVGSATSFAAVRLEGEGRNDHRTASWDALIGSGRFAWYVKPGAAHLFIAGVEFAGARRTRVPFQLMLGDRQGGVRGYGASRDAGAVRGVVRLEERWAIGRVPRHGAIGLASFVDGGQVWAGDAPFGVNSGPKIAIGLGVLAAFPAQSQRLWRVDVAAPVSPDARAHVEVRLTSVWTRGFWREPGDVARGRAGVAPSTIFTWP